MIDETHVFAKRANAAAGLNGEPVPRSRFYIGPTLLLQLHHAHHA